MPNINITNDLSPVLSELFKTRAEIKTLIRVILDDDQLNEFDEKYSETLKEIILESLETFPNLFSDAHEYRKKLGV